MAYQLTVQKVEQTCLFTLTWGRGQQIPARLPYPPALDRVYRQWQRAYLDFYQQPEQAGLRGRPGAVGQVMAQTVDCHSQLVQAEARLLSEFHRWLRHGELYDIRRCLGQRPATDPGELFLTCHPLALARLPWEAWEIGAEFGRAPVHLVRSPMTVQGAPPPPGRRYRARVLVILGDDTGIGLSGDRQALTRLSHLVDVTVVGWTPGQDTVALKQAIGEAIADPQGWDVLFFAGHSNEAAAVDGVIYVAPQTALSIRELTPALQAAKTHGLQFALFNSCSGLNIAEALVDLGLSQVAVMREPIHNAVALVFVQEFLQALARHEDVQAALAAACRHLKLDQQITYPSAYLIPSLFRHPDSVPFRIEPRSWRHLLRRWLPGRRQTAALVAVALLSGVPAVRESLLSGRLLTQAIYRNLTGQLPAADPPVVLVQIDDASIRRSPLLANPSPINLEYLALVVEELRSHGVKVVGIDYLIDRPRDNAAILTAALARSVESNQTWFVFFSHWINGEEIGPNSAVDLTDLRWSMQGLTDAYPWYLMHPWSPDSCLGSCPFSYLLALSALYERTADPPTVQPTLTNRDRLNVALLEDIRTRQRQDTSLARLARRHSPALTVSPLFLSQRWLYPFVDFSIPPNRVMHRISAHRLLAGLDGADIAQLQAADVVLIGAVGYSEAIGDGWEEIHPEPWAFTYWRTQGEDTDTIETFSGVEFLAYSTHHFLRNQGLVAIPTLWMVGLAAGVGRGWVLWRERRERRERRSDGWRSVAAVMTASGVYGLGSVQLALWTPVVLPWLLPTVTVWIYVIPALVGNRLDTPWRRRNDGFR
jgi:hypothetical protein